MPASPRLAKVSTPLRAVAKPSISLMGRDEEMKSDAPLGIPLPISRATSASDQLVKSDTFLAVRCENLFQRSTYSPSTGGTSTTGRAANF